MPLVFGCLAPHPPVLIPEIGGPRVNEVKATATALSELAVGLAAARPDTVVLISPHCEMYRTTAGIIAASTSFGDLSMWGARGLSFRFDNDLDLVEKLRLGASKESLSLDFLGEGPHELDHGALVPLHFFRAGLGDARLVPVVFTRLGVEAQFAVGQMFGRLAGQLDRRVAIVASGDLSHRLTEDGPYSFDPMGPIFDKLMVDIFQAADAGKVRQIDPDLVQRAGQCGLGSIAMLLGAFSSQPFSSSVLSYEGPFGVGYLVARLTPTDATSEEEQTIRQEPAPHPLVRLARQTVEAYVRDQQVTTPEMIIPEMAEEAGVFVSLKKRGELRGCIGTFEPMYGNVGEEVVHNAISAATRDPRFPPVGSDELIDLDYSVDVLTAPEPIEGVRHLDPRRYGVIVRHGDRRGLLLPALEGIDTAEQQVDIARRKAGISKNDPYKLYRFEVRRFY